MNVLDILDPKMRGFLIVGAVLLSTTVFVTVLYSIRQQQVFVAPAQTFDYQACVNQGGEVLPEGSSCNGESIPITINSSVDAPEGAAPTADGGSVQVNALCCIVKSEPVPAPEVTVLPPAEPEPTKGEEPVPPAEPTEAPAVSPETPSEAVPTPTLTPAPVPTSAPGVTKLPGEDPTASPVLSSALEPTKSPSLVTATPSPTEGVTSPSGTPGDGNKNSCELPDFTVRTVINGCDFCSQ